MFVYNYYIICALCSVCLYIAMYYTSMGFSYQLAHFIIVYDNTTTKSTSPDDEAESLQPASSSGPSTTPSCGRSWSLDSKYINVNAS